MFQRPLNIFTVDLPMKRPFHWRAFLTLVTLYFLGNLAGVPLLRATNVPIEPVWFWGIVTLISTLLIALSLALANGTGLGSPLLEGRLPEEDLPAWLRSGLALTVLMSMVSIPLSLILNLNIDPASYPIGWQLVLASLKAGIVEEVICRLFLISLFVWLGSFFKCDDEGRPTRVVYWVAILLAGLLFGWAHVDARLSIPDVPLWALAGIMVLSTFLGSYFGWLFWKLGLEWAMLAHFMYDAFISAIVIPAYLLNSPLVWAILVTGLAIASVISGRVLTQTQPNARSQKA